MSLESLLAELQPLASGGEALLVRLAGISLSALALALALHVVKLGVRARAWHNIVRAAYPTDPLRFRETLGAFLAGIGIDAFAPARAGQVLRVGLLRRRLPSSTFPGLASTLFAESIFNLLLAALIVGAAIAFGLAAASPGGAFSLGPVAQHPLIVALAVSSLAVGIGCLGFCFRARLRSLVADARRGFSIFANPATYVRGVVSWQALGWGLRVGSVYWFLVAFHLRASLGAALLVVAVQLLASALPLSPGGAGPQQAMLVVAFSASTAAAVLGFGVGMQAATALADLALGAAALIVMTGSLRWRRLATGRDVAALPLAHPAAAAGAR